MGFSPMIMVWRMLRILPVQAAGLQQYNGIQMSFSNKTFQPLTLNKAKRFPSPNVGETLVVSRNLG